jgi:hypothetical protein
MFKIGELKTENSQLASENAALAADALLAAEAMHENTSACRAQEVAEGHMH